MTEEKYKRRLHGINIEFVLCIFLKKFLKIKVSSPVFYFYVKNILKIKKKSVYSNIYTRYKCLYETSFFLI